MISQQVPRGQESCAQGLLSGFAWVDFLVPQIPRSWPMPEESLSHSSESLLNLRDLNFWKDQAVRKEKCFNSTDVVYQIVVNQYQLKKNK